MQIIGALSLLSVALLFAGCAADSPLAMRSLSPEKLETADQQAIIKSIAWSAGAGWGMDAELKAAFLKKAKMTTEADLENAYKGNVKIGMSEACALIAASKVQGYYPPEVNVTNTMGEETVQYVIRRFQSDVTFYIYTKNGRITGWQY